MMKSKNRKFLENKAALRSVQLIETFEAGICLEGWEVKAIRSGQVQMAESHVRIKQQEAYWVGAHIAPTCSTSTHTTPHPLRDRKLLLKRKTILKCGLQVKEKGLTLIPVNLHLSGPWIKLTFALAKGVKQFDRRQKESKRGWQVEQARLLKKSL